jgi:aryl-alcohol dehydrogenase-like predicted oxidoreductase
MCKAEGMAIAVWGAMGGGKFKNAEQPVEAGRSAAVDDRSGKSAEDFQSVFKRLEKAEKRKGASSMNVAMRYIMLKVCASCFLLSASSTRIPCENATPVKIPPFYTKNHKIQYLL